MQYCPLNQTQDLYMMNLMHTITLFVIGFSIFTCLLLLLIGWEKADQFFKTFLGKLAMILLLAALTAIQVFHYLNLELAQPLFSHKPYAALLLVAAPSFFLFSRAILQPDIPNTWANALHFIPLLLVVFVDAQLLIPASFVLGMAYAIWICYQLYQLRDKREYFQLELRVFVGFALNSVLILVVGLLALVIRETPFTLTYANLIGLSLFAMLYIQLRFPDLTQKTQEVVAMRYTASTLKNQDVAKLVTQLKHLLEVEKLYRQEDISLTRLAERMQVSNHQLSELINSQFELGFSKLIRDYRIKEAKVQLVEQPKASVLSIGMEVGFSSQSNFYTAFKEITGETPGQFRKRLG
ncbi:MAG: AraC family transcriptional regulator, partial [Moraxellaceae bacterium]